MPGHFSVYMVLSGLNMEKNIRKKFMDAVSDGDTDTLETLAGQLSDDCLAGLQKEIWDAEADPLPEARIDAAYREFSRRTGSRRMRVFRNSFLAAACAAASLVAGILIGGISSDGISVPEAVSWIECSTAYGSTDEVTLPDGSHVYVNSGSILLYPDRMDGATREIHLAGEAFFEVAKDTLHPFIVHAGGSKIRVTGTKFNVKAYVEDSKVTATLVEGGVDVTFPSVGGTFRLTPGKAVSYEKGSADAAVYNVNRDMYPSWFKNEFNAYNMTLAEIARDLERRFNIRIAINDSNLADLMFYASFVNGESAEDIINALNVRKSFVIRKEGGVICLSSI